MGDDANARDQVNSAPGLEDLLKAHIRVVAAQRNVNGLAASLREAQQQAEVRQKEFQQLTVAVEARTGLRYNEESLSLEPKRK